VKGKLRTHLLSILIVAGAFTLLLTFARSGPDPGAEARRQFIAPFLELEFLDPGDPLHRALLKETLRIYYPSSGARIDSLLRAIDAVRQEQFASATEKTGAEAPGWTFPKLTRLIPMYVQFVVVYGIVLLLTLYGAQTLGTYRFILDRQGTPPPLRRYWGNLAQALQTGDLLRIARTAVGGAPLLGLALLKGMAYAVLFAPAYVIAYSLKTRVDTDSYLFMIALGVVSNGMLITYANKFYLYLVHESRKGYVETAIVKNLARRYRWSVPGGIPRRAVLRITKRFGGHILHHIYENARFQYIPALKEQATYLVTGLIIIEMALNIQGHFCYEMLQNILRNDLTVAAGMLMAIFVLVKATDILVDLWYERESRRYGHPEVDQ
jgi:hypothetical protein